MSGVETRIRTPPKSDGELLERICAFIADAADVPAADVSANTHIYEELGVDSLGATAIFIDVAYEFGIPEPAEPMDYAAINTASKIVEYVRQYGTGE